MNKILLVLILSISSLFASNEAEVYKTNSQMSHAQNSIMSKEKMHSSDMYKIKTRNKKIVKCGSGKCGGATSPHNGSAKCGTVTIPTH